MQNVSLEIIELYILENAIMPQYNYFKEIAVQILCTAVKNFKNK